MNTSHYPSLELCRKLTEIGFPETEKVMYLYKDGPQIGNPHWVWLPENPYEEYRCPSVMEMLDVMPLYIEGEDYYLTIGVHNNEGVRNYIVSYVRMSFRVEDTLPNALAEMILWLVDNGYINFNAS